MFSAVKPRYIILRHSHGSNPYGGSHRRPLPTRNLVFDFVTTMGFRYIDPPAAVTYLRAILFLTLLPRRFFYILNLHVPLRLAEEGIHEGYTQPHPLVRILNRAF